MKKKIPPIALSGIVLAAITALVVLYVNTDSRKAVNNERNYSTPNSDIPSNLQSKSEQTKSVRSSKALLPEPTRNNNYQEVTVRVFHDALQCHSSFASLKNMNKQVETCEAFAADLKNQEFYKSCKANIEGFEDKIRVAALKLEACGPQSEIENSYYQAVVHAAQAGDVDAQMCYVQANFNLNRQLSEAEVQEYKKDAIDYANAAFDRGDWRIVQLLNRTGNSISHTGELIHYLTPGTYETVYRMNRLLRLGAVGEYAQNLDLLAPRNQLSPEEITKSNDWAQQEYSQHFANSLPLIADPKPCFSL